MLLALQSGKETSLFRPLDEATCEADVLYIEREIENRRLKERINTLEDEAAEQDAKLHECLADKHDA